MQPLAGQDLLHTQPHSMHWLATATAISAVIAVSSLIQPPDATATAVATTRSARSAPAPDPGRVTFPVDCGPNRLDVTRKVSGDLDGTGGTETVAVVRCHSDTGTPPSGVYVLAQPSDPKAAPRIVATLLAPAQRLTVQDLDIQGREISTTLLGYSTLDVPRCCPDVHKSLKWQWRGGKFVQSELPAGATTEGA
ncbi:hypothetical protein GCM10010211_51340 [Streptomyces albospinus]|uniref:Secreted protein n=1 Tax=Streptomyces albospinus TaxID=285515 RepID=A0ABQ2VC86_9ACTN|nr:hypothetical protein [Streptomyces albospinus]GGU79108.1 hypothetical protein GCM10010211_51340 [Streptomyces albospinus]